MYNEETQQRLKAVAIHREIQIARRQDAAEARREADEGRLDRVRSRRYRRTCWLGDRSANGRTG